MSNLHVLDATGDSVTPWNKDNQAEIDAARKVFDDFKRKNYLAYSVEKSGNSIVHNFNPELELIVMTPPNVGG